MHPGYTPPSTSRNTARTEHPALLQPARMYARIVGVVCTASLVLVAARSVWDVVEQS